MPLLRDILFGLKQQIAELNCRAKWTAQLVREVLREERHHKLLVLYLLGLKEIRHIVQVDQLLALRNPLNFGEPKVNNRFIFARIDLETYLLVAALASQPDSFFQGHQVVFRVLLVVQTVLDLVNCQTL